MPGSRYDVAVIGGGFYGCCVALFLRSLAERIVIFERGENLMQRASLVNQARVHTGFHYPRSFVTALRSLHNHRRFANDFGTAIRNDFRMLYAIAKYGSKVGARRFEAMFNDMGAQISRASPAQRAIFNVDTIEEVFLCAEYAFDANVLRTLIRNRLDAAGIEIRLKMPVERVDAGAGEGPILVLSSGDQISAAIVFNCTYARLNHTLRKSGLSPIPIKYELAEIALMSPPAELAGLGVTVMDGPFFSFMPYPALGEGVYSLTHVRYTPHFGWTEGDGLVDPYAICDEERGAYRWRHKLNDAVRFVPALQNAVWRESLLEIKVIPVRNEIDDGRPILLTEHADCPGLYSVLGSKIDNIYDLFFALSGLGERWAQANTNWLTR